MTLAAAKPGVGVQSGGVPGVLIRCSRSREPGGANAGQQVEAMPGF
jgi:hypothetical protein